jgi:hypothetical protein
MPLIGYLIEKLIVTQLVKTSAVMEQRLAFSTAGH